LPVTAADGTTPLGSMSMTVKVGGVRASLFNGQLNLQTTHRVASGTGLFGDTAQPSVVTGALASGSLAAAWNATLGAKSDADLRDQINSASGLNLTTWADSQSSAVPFNSPASYYSGTYGLGIASGDDITVTFTNAVTTTTAWKSALKATITYL